MIKLSIFYRVFDLVLKFLVQTYILLAFYGVSLYIFFEGSFEFKTFSILFLSIAYAYVFLRIYGKYSNLSMNSLKFKLMLNNDLLILSILLMILVLSFVIYDFTFVIFNFFHATALFFLILYGVLRFHIRSSFVWFSFSKIGIVAIVWSLFILGFITSPSFFIGASIFFMILGLMIPFEIKDIKKDYEDKTLSVVHVYGIQNSKVIGYVFFGLSSLSFSFYSTQISFLSAWVVSCIIGALFLLVCDESKSDFFYFVLVDGVLALPLFFKFILLSFSE
jgi:hypothetical protein